MRQKRSIFESRTHLSDLYRSLLNKKGLQGSPLRNIRKFDPCQALRMYGNSASPKQPQGGPVQGYCNLASIGTGGHGENTTRKTKVT